MTFFTNKWFVFLAVIAAAGLIAACKGTEDLSLPGSTNYYKVEKPAGFTTFYDNPENRMTVEGVALGRFLFYDSLLSENYTISCGSCHKQEHAFTDNERVSLGVHGLLGERNSMTLVNIGFDPGPFFWDGRAATLELQIEQPVFNPVEMNLTWEEAVHRLQASAFYEPKFAAAFGRDEKGKARISKQTTVNALAQFMRTIVSANSKYDKFQATMDLNVFTPLERAGFSLFSDDPILVANTRSKEPGSGVDCGHCHTFPLFQQEPNLRFLRVLMNNGNVDKTTGKVVNVKVPSLRNIGYTGPYMHDGKFATLEEVVDFYNAGSSQMTKSQFDAMDDQMYIKLRTHGNPSTLEMSETEKQALLAFLNTLNDPSLLTNPAYSNPFHK